MQFPIIYVDLDTSEHDLFEISFDDWYHDVDAQHAIGPIEPGRQFALDDADELYRVVFLGMDASNVPKFEFERCDDSSILNEMRKYVADRR